MSLSELHELAPALVSFQASVPTIPKNRVAKIPTKNGGSYTYKFADLTDMWDAIRVPLKENGLAVTQALVGGSSGWTGIKTTVWHSSGQTFAETVEMQTQGKSAQEIGSQVTYFKRYALSATLGIATEEDDDGSAASKADPVPGVVYANQDDLNALKAASDRAGASKEDVEAFLFQFDTSLKNLTRDQAKTATDHFTAQAVAQELAGA